MKRSTRSLVRGVFIALLLLPGCAAWHHDAPPPAWLERLSAAPMPPPGDNWPLPPQEMQRVLRTAAFEPREHHGTGSGVTGAMRLTVYFPALGRRLDLKWKVAPIGDAEGWNNSPRRELASYELQKWFLAPSEYVVPTTVARCLPLDVYQRIDAGAEPNLPDTRCVFGVAAVWLENVETPEVLFEEARFERDPAYARHFANFNLLNYLVDNRDLHDGNVLTSKDDSNRHVFAVDNGIAFGEPLYNFFMPNWRRIRVPALPRDSIDRLRRVRREDAALLAVVAEFRCGQDGVLRQVRPRPPLDLARGSSFRDGVLQLGLTSREIEAVWRRVQGLLRDVDRGRIEVF